MGLAGAGYGAARGLEEILGEQMKRALLAQQQQEAEARMALEQQQLNQRALEHDTESKQRQQQIDMQAGDRRERNNVRGVRRMLGEAIVQRTGPMTSDDRRGMAALQVEAGDEPTMLNEPKVVRHPVTVPGPNGAPLRKLVTEDELAGGVQEYREPKTPTKPDYQRVVVDGKETFLTPEEVRQRGGVEAASRKRASTGAERQALGFHNRMRSAIEDMDAVEEQLSERDLALINNSPLPDLINNRLLSGPGQQYAQALKTYTEARLRKESGAAVQEFEYANDRKAISKQVGDQPEALKQKRFTRKKTAEGIAFAAGPAYEEYYGEPFQRMQEKQEEFPEGTMQKPIPGIPGAIAESRDGGKTWKRVK